MTEQTGIITNIQHFSVDDGPGIRTTVFFKGCNLRCRWCHNPETYNKQPQLEFIREKCSGCGRCAEICTNGAQIFRPRMIDRDRCQACGACVAVCSKRALSIVGRTVGVSEVLSQLLNDQHFYAASGGGITCSGGEPLLQADFLAALLAAAKQHGLHTAVDTAGAVDFSAFEQVLPYADLFLYDIKLFDADAHRAATGIDNALILANLRCLAEQGARIIIRTPLIAGINDNLQQIENIAAFLQPFSVELVQLLPYHSYGQGKYDAMGLTYNGAAFAAPSEKFLNQAVAIYHSFGINAEV